MKRKEQEYVYKLTKEGFQKRYECTFCGKKECPLRSSFCSDECMRKFVEALGRYKEDKEKKE